MDLSTIKVGFLGAGKMATALAAGFCRELLTPGQITAVDPSEAARNSFTETIGESTVVSNDSAVLADNTDVLILAVKPQVLVPIVESLGSSLDSSSLVVSIAAGVTVEAIEQALPDHVRLIRVMPNTPCLVGKGACGVTAGTHATQEDVDLVCKLLGTVGVVEQVSEPLLDVVTGVSGSGPAYVFQMIEALSDGGVRMGLPRDTATRLAAQTLAGAAEMVLQTGTHPGALKDAVTSPGGTTIAAIHELERAGLRAALMNAVEAATLKSQELGR